MINALTTQITNIIQKEFLFAAFLPTLIFGAALFITFGKVVGFLALIEWSQGQTTGEKVVIPAAITVAVTACAYILTGIRPVLWRFWSGELSLVVFAPLLRIGEAVARLRRERLVRASRAKSVWAELPDWFRLACAKWNIKRTKADPPKEKIEAARQMVARLSASMGAEGVKRHIRARFINLVDQYDATELSPLYAEIWAKLRGWSDEETFQENTNLWEIDRQFGEPESIRATRLGNVIESYQTYSYRRYGMEPEVFWPHLQQHITSEEMKRMLADARTILDFALSMVSFAALYVLLCLFIGPWFLADLRFWLIFASVGSAVAFLFYVVAWSAAVQFGDLFRACFDLYRLALLKALSREFPRDTEQERGKWEQLSQVVVYGRSTKFELTDPSAAGAMGGALQ
jgi:ABC-type multidrug transport system fused ATPase/permease subunit